VRGRESDDPPSDLFRSTRQRREKPAQITPRKTKKVILIANFLINKKVCPFGPLQKGSISRKEKGEIYQIGEKNREKEEHPEKESTEPRGGCAPLILNPSL